VKRLYKKGHTLQKQGKISPNKRRKAKELKTPDSQSHTPELKKRKRKHKSDS